MKIVAVVGAHNMNLSITTCAYHSLSSIPYLNLTLGSLEGKSNSLSLSLSTLDIFHTYFKDCTSIQHFVFDNGSKTCEDCGNH